jgi:hypothetical protein
MWHVEIKGIGTARRESKKMQTKLVGWFSLAVFV